MTSMKREHLFGKTNPVLALETGKNPNQAKLVTVWQREATTHNNGLIKIALIDGAMHAACQR